MIRMIGPGAATAELLSLAADAIILRASSASPPGSRIEGKIPPLGEATLRIKVHSCKAEPGGTFLIAGRPIDLARDLREQLAARIGGTSGADGT